MNVYKQQDNSSAASVVCSECNGYGFLYENPDDVTTFEVCTECGGMRSDKVDTSSPGDYKRARGVLSGLGDEPAEVSIRRLRDNEVVDFRGRSMWWLEYLEAAAVCAEAGHEWIKIDSEGRRGCGRCGEVRGE